MATPGTTLTQLRAQDELQQAQRQAEEARLQVEQLRQQIAQLQLPVQGQAQEDARRQQAQAPAFTRYGVPDSKKRKLEYKPFDGSEVYKGLGAGFHDWGRRFVRQVAYGEAACGFLWSEEVKVDLLSYYLDGSAQRYFTKQLDMWWGDQTLLTM